MKDNKINLISTWRPELVTYCLHRRKRLLFKRTGSTIIFFNSKALVLVHTKKKPCSTVSQTTCGEKIINLLTKLPSLGDGKEISLEREEVN